MILIASRLPVLQVGDYQLKNYDTKWLKRAIEVALLRAGMDNTEIAHDVYSGVLHYLENDCPWTALKVEDLYAKVHSLLEKIGLGRAQGHLPMYSPEVEISVVEQLKELDCQIELALFGALRAECETLHGYGVERIVMAEVKEAVSELIAPKRWNKECQRLHDEITSLSDQYSHVFSLSDV